MIRRPPRSTLDRSSAASDVYKRQRQRRADHVGRDIEQVGVTVGYEGLMELVRQAVQPVSYTHLRAHETVLDLVCRLLLEKKKLHKYSTLLTRYSRHTYDIYSNI